MARIELQINSMRYQERIYIQNNNDAVRNKDILSFNMSSDMSIFEGPLFNVSGASKIDCTGITSSYVISTATIPLTFVFTANTAHRKRTKTPDNIILVKVIMYN
jgi:hypothetical protein